MAFCREVVVYRMGVNNMLPVDGVHRRTKLGVILSQSLRREDELNGRGKPLTVPNLFLKSINTNYLQVAISESLSCTSDPFSELI